MSTSIKYAAYGSNLHPRRLTARIASARLEGTSRLPNWSLHFHKRSKDGSGKCNIVPGSNGVYVAIFDIGVDDEIILDEIEGVGAGYSKIALGIPGFGDCMSYAAQQSHIDDTLLPYDWYKELVLAGACTLRFPGEYLNGIHEIAARHDPDPDRRTEMWSTVEMVKGASQRAMSGTGPRCANHG